MKTTNKTRIGALLLLLVMLIGTLAGCSSSASVALTKPEFETQKGNLNPDQLGQVADLIVKTNDDTKFPILQYLEAAERGYNMVAEGFEDKPEYATVNGDADPASTAVEILNKANESLKAKKRIDAGNYNNMNQADLEYLLERFQKKVDVNGEGGIWDKILCWIGTALNWITNTMGGKFYIIGICIFAVIIEILMLPFAVKQQKNSIRQANLRPKEMAIRNKYKGRNDQKTAQKIQQEIQELYQKENYSPYNGCLPLLLQFPILIALYNIVIDPLHYVLGQASGVSTALTSYYTSAYAAGGMGQKLQSTRSTIELLSKGGIDQFSDIQNFGLLKNGGEVWNSLQNVTASPNFNIFKWNFGLTPSFDNFNILLLVPVLTFVVYFFSMRLSRKFTNQSAAQPGMDPRQAACSNAMMDITMPLMSTFFAFLVPAIVGVYWIFRSIIGTLKQFIMSRLMPLPVFSEEDYKKAAKEMAGKSQNQNKVEKSDRVGKVRSLHYIDDEDFEDTRARGIARREAMEAEQKRKQEENGNKSRFGNPERKPENDKKTEENVGSDVQDQPSDSEKE